MARITIHIEQHQKDTNVVKVTLTNNTHIPLRMLKWKTPFDNVINDSLIIRLNDYAEANFIGVRAKRIYDFKHSTLYIPPKGTISSEVTIEESWDINTYAVYTIELANKKIKVCEVKNETENVQYDSLSDMAVESLKVKVLLKPKIKEWLTHIEIAPFDNIEIDAFEDELMSGAPVCTPNYFCFPPAYKNGGECVHLNYLAYPKLTKLQNDKGVIKQYADMHKACLRQSTTWHPNKWDFHKDPTYRKWFGAYNKTRALHVAQVLRSIASIKSCLGFHIYFDWSDGDTIAYWRQSNDPRELSVLGLTKLYFKAPHGGTDSKLGTLAHEFSHAYGRTNDSAYGHRDCLNLAKRNPDSAIQNADNYQYYLEEKIGF
ncbi:hypothetical protein F0229_10875 [Vibrio sp. AIC-3]|uniref:M35 family metallopeptidase n=1 Tax=Vibrio sp. AIC-3 TaxID=2607604 RepID=UPI001493D3BC|nr:M35 family metallopeptidase [Vibrio sp. AIC-3]NOH93057.1 hypothetical protein [Vibrio sp. AIC-3]